MKSTISLTSISSARHRHDDLNLEPMKSNLSLFRTRSAIYPEFIIGYPDETDSDLSYGSESIKPIEINQWKHQSSRESILSNDDPTTRVVDRLLARERDIHNEVIKSWREGITNELPDLTSFTNSSLTSSEKIDESETVEDDGKHSSSIIPIIRRTQSLDQIHLKSTSFQNEIEGLESNLNFHQVENPHRSKISSVRDWIKEVSSQLDL
ncbi:hypothetical protein DFH28DRAFT_882055 [Melampsora americana]|nr:hypothetical protein DFH28DRAFT_882055 [Melampsora americana]